LCKTVKYSPYSRWKKKPDGKKTIERVAKDLNLTPDQLYKKDKKYPYSPPQIVEEMAKWMGIHAEIKKWIDTFPKIENSDGIASQNNKKKNASDKIEEKEVLPTKSKKKKIVKEKSGKIDIAQNDKKTSNNNEITQVVKEENKELTSSEMQELDAKFNELHELEKLNPKGFHIDFDFSWKKLEYSKKENAKRTLESTLEKDFDYYSEMSNNQTRGKPKEIIKLTCDGFKQFCLQAPTPKGKLIRKYFIEAEKRWHMLKENISNGNIELKDNQTGEILNAEHWKEKYESSLLELQKKDHTHQYKSFLDTERVFIMERKRYWEPLLCKFYDTPMVYIASIGIHTVAENENQSSPKLEIGKSEDWKKRMHAHQNEFETFDIIGLFKVTSPLQSEREILTKMKQLNLITTHPNIKGGIHREVIFSTEQYSTSKLLEIIREICELPALFDSTRDLEMENIKLKCEIESLKKEMKYKILLAKKGIDIPDDF
jgi:phage anti-repressor protein